MLYNNNPIIGTLCTFEFQHCNLIYPRYRGGNSIINSNNLAFDCFINDAFKDRVKESIQISYPRNESVSIVFEPINRDQFKTAPAKTPHKTPFNTNENTPHITPYITNYATFHMTPFITEDITPIHTPCITNETTVPIKTEPINEPYLDTNGHLRRKYRNGVH